MITNNIRYTKFFKEYYKKILKYRDFDLNKSYILAVSGGIDSIFATHFFYTLGVKFFPVFVKYPFISYDVELKKYFKAQFGIDLKVIPTNITANNCYECAKKRRELIFKYADNIGVYNIIYAHHRDDFFESFFLSLFYGADFSFMKIETLFFNKFILFRPLFGIDKKAIVRYVKKFDLNYWESECSVSNKKRDEIRQFIENLPEMYKKNLFNALKKVV